MAGVGGAFKTRATERMIGDGGWYSLVSGNTRAKIIISVASKRFQGVVWYEHLYEQWNHTTERTTVSQCYPDSVFAPRFGHFDRRKTKHGLKVDSSENGFRVYVPSLKLEFTADSRDDLTHTLTSPLSSNQASFSFFSPRK